MNIFFKNKKGIGWRRFLGWIIAFAVLAFVLSMIIASKGKTTSIIATIFGG